MLSSIHLAIMVASPRRGTCNGIRWTTCGLSLSSQSMFNISTVNMGLPRCFALSIWDVNTGMKAHRAPPLTPPALRPTCNK